LYNKLDLKNKLLQFGRDNCSF